MEADSTDSASIRSLIVVVAEVNTDVEVVVIPIRFMVSAPLPGGVHPVDVVIDLAAVLAVAADIAVDSGAIRFQPVMTILFPIPIRASGTAESEYKSAGQCASENHPTQELFARHDCLPGLVSAGGRAPSVLSLLSPGGAANYRVKGVVCRSRLPTVLFAQEIVGACRDLQATASTELSFRNIRTES
jgi:hypothetical protein